MFQSKDNVNFSKTFCAESFFKSLTWIALKFSLSILTLYAVVWEPNKAKPLAPKCAAMCAGPVSFATTKELSFISAASSEISKDLFSFKIEIALISFVLSISLGPGATMILYSSLNLFLIKFISSL